MYFPYFRGRKHELLTLRTLSKRVAEAETVIPIIEPVTLDPSSTKRALEVFGKENMPHILIRNPHVGPLNQATSAERTSFFKAFTGIATPTIHGFILGSGTSLTDVKGFFGSFGTEPTALIHWSEFSDLRGLGKAVEGADEFTWHIFLENKTTTTYRDGFKPAARVLIRDGFSPEARNADYCADELFFDLNATYKKFGFKGFGDFLTVGERFKDTGGPAHAVAIHLTYQRDNSAIWIRHFVSDTITMPPADPAMKFGEAVAKLVKFIDHRPPDFAYSTACNEFRQCHRHGTFPGLGKAKELSMQHHVELMLDVV